MRAEIICSAGGVWDRQRRDWKRNPDGTRVTASRPVVIDLMESQIETARWAAERIAAFRERRSHPQAVAEMLSDRRAGKTFLGDLIVLLVAIDCPSIGSELPLVAWLVSVSHPARDELDRIIKAILPADMYRYSELPKRQFILAHGSVIQHKTIDDVESLRAGYVDVALLNEAANMPFAAYQLILRATQDRAGFLVLTTNRPKRTKGNWVIRLADAAEADKRAGLVPAVRLFKLDPKHNAAIRQDAKSVIDRALRYGVEEGEDLDEGVILEADQKLLAPPYDPARHVKPLPLLLVDITLEVTQRLYGRGYKYLVGGDFQQQCAATLFRIMARGASPECWKDFTMVAERSWFLASGGDEDDLIDTIEADRVTASDCLVIGDCSGGWQKGDHGYGPVSYAVFKRRGWEITYPTKKKTKESQHPKNPPVEQSVGQFRKIITADRFVVAAGEQTKDLQKALHKCDALVDRYGNLRPKGIHAHLVDTCRYPLWYLATRIDSASAALPNYVTGRR